MDDECKKILLIEDNPNDEELIMLSFEKKGISSAIHVVHDGAEALEYLFGAIDGDELRDPHPNLVLLDLDLPKIKGLEVLRKIKKHPDAKKMLVVVFTALKDEKNRVESERLHTDGFIEKPMDYNEFPKAIEQIGLAWIMKPNFDT